MADPRNCGERRQCLPEFQCQRPRGKLGQRELGATYRELARLRLQQPMGVACRHFHRSLTARQTYLSGFRMRPGLLVAWLIGVWM